MELPQYYFAWACCLTRRVIANMSHNLYFRKVRPNGIVEFPIQTPTNISNQIIAASNKCDKIRILEQYLYDCKWDTIDVEQVIRKVDWLMQREDLTLEMN